MTRSNLVLLGECPPGTQVRYLLSAEKVSVGRRQGDIDLHDLSVSHDHAVFTWSGEGWTVTDQGSRNGTFVNGVSIQRQPIFPGDTIKFGCVSFHVVDPELDASGDDAETCVPTQALGTDPITQTPHGAAAQALVGRSEPLKCAMRIAARAAKSNATILLYGESGTGKELFARLVWEESCRADKKFLPVHSGAFQASLLADALFGHEKGAFSGADKQKKGLFEEAGGGTIFLDEIGESDLETQVKLLRVLQEGEFMRLGGTEPIKVDVRVICATNRDLKKAVKEGKFREDLYYRLNVIQIQLPPLRERPGDIADLVNYYVQRFGGPFKRVGSEAMNALVAYNWPGNVRELRNTVERMVVLSQGNELGEEDLPKEIRENRTAVVVTSAPTPTPTSVPTHTASPAAAPSSESELPPLSLEEMEKRMILQTLTKCGGNKSQAAEMLGISRSTLHTKLARYGVSLDD